MLPSSLRCATGTNLATGSDLSNPIPYSTSSGKTAACWSEHLLTPLYHIARREENDMAELEDDEDLTRFDLDALIAAANEIAEGIS